MALYKKILHVISICLRDFATLLLAVMICTYFMEIARRLIISKSFLWVQELNIILIVWMVFLGAAHMYLSFELLRVDFLFTKTKGLTRLIWSLAIHVVSIYVLYNFIVQSYKYMMHILPTLTNAMEVSSGWYALPLLLSSIFMALGWVGKVYDAFAEYKEYRRCRRQPHDCFDAREVANNG